MKLLGLGLTLLVVVGVAAAGFVYVYERNLPMYEVGQQAPVDGVAVNTLSRGDLLYVSGPFEFSLEVIEEPFDITWFRRIGKTFWGQAVNKPKGQDGSRYVFTRGFMDPDTVYRNSGSTAPASLSELDVAALEYIQGQGGPPTIKRTRDGALIRDVVSTLTSGTGVNAQILPSGGIYHLRLLSEQLPGLAYFAYVIVDDHGAVYLAQRGEENALWIPASAPLSQWLR